MNQSYMNGWRCLCCDRPRFWRWRGARWGNWAPCSGCWREDGSVSVAHWRFHRENKTHQKCVLSKNSPRTYCKKRGRCASRTADGPCLPPLVVRESDRVTWLSRLENKWKSELEVLMEKIGALARWTSLRPVSLIFPRWSVLATSMTPYIQHYDTLSSRATRRGK